MMPVLVAAVVVAVLVGGAAWVWASPRPRYRLAVALYALAQRAAGGVCLCAYCVTFATARASRKEWRARYRAGWSDVARIRNERRRQP